MEDAGRELHRTHLISQTPGPSGGASDVARFIQSMFVRRLLGLACLTALGLSILAMRLADLTLRKGESLRVQAQNRLTRQAWTPTIRGTIYDRAGRVLAQDRASFSIAIDYQALTGEWSRAQARKLAARLVGMGWSQMSKSERTELVDALLPAFEDHSRRGWERLSRELDIPAVELEERRLEIVHTISNRQEQVIRQRVDQQVKKAAAQGNTLSETQIAALKREASGPIAEMRQPHVVAPNVAEMVGFACRALIDEEAELLIPARSPAGQLAGLDTDRRELLPVVPGLVVLDAGEREYPLESLDVTLDTSFFPSPIKGDDRVITVDGVLTHILGKMRSQIYGDTTSEDDKVIQGDASRRRHALDADPLLKAAAILPTGEDRGAYREVGDRIGESGIEASQELSLRGLRGLHVTDLETNERTMLEPVSGKNVTLTIDAKLQATIQAAMSPDAGLAVVQPWQGSMTSDPDGVPLAIGTPLAGAAVVLDIASGDILAAVSTPNYSRAQLASDPMGVYGDEIMRPAVNRPWAAEYPPGSIVKPLVFVGAYQHGEVGIDEHIACTGFYIPNRPGMLQCLIWKRYRTTHSVTLNHDPDPIEAIGVSCNIYFYTMGDRLGKRGIAEVYREFGVTEKFGMGAGYEAPGRLGSNGIDSLKPGDAIQLGIGQGPMTWTPLHAANAYATLARGGIFRKPRVILNGDPDPGIDIKLAPEAVAKALAGLDFAVNNPEHSTGHHLTINERREPIFNAPSVKVWGKTGTATAPDLLDDDPDGNGPLKGDKLRSGDHSWFVVLVGRGQPQYAIAVIVEYGGSGAKVSGPIVNQIIHALVRENYL
jgi:penicillin-binding protein 2